MSLLYLATGDWRVVAGGVALLLLAGLFAYFAFSLVTLRIDAWWNPWPDADDRAFLASLDDERGMFRQLGDSMGGPLGG